jgi:hypothetical protein
VGKRKIAVSTGHSNLVVWSAACDYNDCAILAPKIYSMLYSSVAIHYRIHFDT